MAIVPHKQIIGQQMATHSFNTKDAEKYGVESAVILYNMRHWLEKNKANNKHNHDGFYWTYNSAKAFEELFPYMNRRTISRNLQKLTFAGVVSVGNYNQKGYDRTQWYTIPMEFAVESKESSNDAIGQNVSAIGQNVSAIGQNVSPIPDINTNNKPDVKQERDAPKPEPVMVEKEVKVKAKFIEPTLDEVIAYCLAECLNMNAETFYYFYAQKDWMVGKNKMKSWTMAAKGWATRQKEFSTNTGNGNANNSKSNQKISAAERVKRACKLDEYADVIPQQYTGNVINCTDYSHVGF